ncbi:hypothetical protein BHAOGJBA_1698 [Methylobacterium hispanicum]|uniref:Uncharacterized protein n=1 Tax=Methylobacterium hispanicum TaxID=270350 RepID=A0AAV4ZK53_9HYPH|nr:MULTISPECIES: hypothetical protein [Methylobacterium]GJD88185.1 hypothetical protein BHAOGJBA_1698 [Methylobacterium hispanicum]
MSIVAYAIRTCLGAALVDRTLAEGRVYDSAVQPIAEMIKPGVKPFLVVSTDDEKISFPSKRWELLDADRTINVVVEVAVGGLTQVEVPAEQGGGTALRLDIPHTDEGLETSLNMIGRQIWREIAVGGPWSDLLKEFACWPKEGAVTRGANTEQGVRYAARQYVFECGTIPEPEFGTEPEGPFATLLEMMAADERLADDVRLVRSMIIGDLLPDWHRAQIELGLTNRSYRALGLGPLFREVGEPLAQRFTYNMAGRSPLIIQAAP